MEKSKLVFPPSPSPADTPYVTKSVSVLNTPQAWTVEDKRREEEITRRILQKAEEMFRKPMLPKMPPLLPGVTHDCSCLQTLALLP